MFIGFLLSASILNSIHKFSLKKTEDVIFRDIKHSDIEHFFN